MIYIHKPLLTIGVFFPAITLVILGITVPACTEAEEETYELHSTCTRISSGIKFPAVAEGYVGLYPQVVNVMVNGVPVRLDQNNTHDYECDFDFNDEPASEPTPEPTQEPENVEPAGMTE